MEANDTDVIVCRCEEVRAKQIHTALSEGARTINDVKRLTRAGMGICQGIYCLHSVASLIQEHIEAPMSAIGPMTPRPPVRLVSIAALRQEVGTPTDREAD